MLALRCPCPRSTLDRNDQAKSAIPTSGIRDHFLSVAPTRRENARPHVIGIVMLAAVALIATTALAGAPPPIVNGQMVPSLAPMLEHVTPAVVNISSTTHVRVHDPYFDDPIFRRFFGVPDVPREQVKQSLGSGVIVDAAKGYVLTNNHVVAGADEISVTLTDGSTVKVRVVGTDPETDIAVLQIPAAHLTALPLADSSKVRVGDFVVAVGDPFGLGQTVTSGIVSALGRSGLRGSGYQNFIQTDASINPGNSGGALVNLAGELIGINSMIFTPSGGNVGIGFAIPSNLAADVMRQLIQYGQVKRGALGVDTQDVTPQLSRLLGIGATRGAVVTRVRPNTPAAKAGLRPGDVIVALAGKPIHSAQDFSNVEGLTAPGSPVPIEILRDGKTLQISTALQTPQQHSVDGARLDPRLAGAQFSDLSADQRRAGLSGVVVTNVANGSRADNSGLQQDDIVVAVNQRNIDGTRELQRMVSGHPRQLLLTLVRGDSAYYLLMP